MRAIGRFLLWSVVHNDFDTPVKVDKVAKFTSSEVSSLKKRLKTLKDSVRADKNKSNNAALLEVRPNTLKIAGLLWFQCVNHCPRNS